MTRLYWMRARRTTQLIAAAGEGRLYYDGLGILESDLAANQRDAGIVADLIATGQLYRLDTGAVIAATALTTHLGDTLRQDLDIEAGLAETVKDGAP